VKIIPLPNERQSAPGKLARYDRSGFNIKDSFILSVDCVEMRSSVFSIEEPYHNPKEPAQLRHVLRIDSFADRDNCVKPGREDVIVAGVLILRTVMETLGYRDCLVSDLGLREGVLIDLARRLEKP